MNIANMDMCSGCGACFSACPKDAIKFQKDEYGREIPKIIEDKCISCNLCVDPVRLISNIFFLQKRVIFVMLCKRKIEMESLDVRLVELQRYFPTCCTKFGGCVWVCV